MADSYEKATVYPQELAKSLFNNDDLEILEWSGFEWDDLGESYYFYSPEYLVEDDDQPRTYVDVFQKAIRQSDGLVSEVVIEGAFTCSKMRPGEFGGFVIRITENDVQSGTTADLRSLVENGLQEHVGAVLDYAFQDELLDFISSSPKRRAKHVFRSLVALQNWNTGQSRTPESYLDGYHKCQVS